MRTKLAVIIGLLLVSCSEEQSNRKVTDKPTSQEIESIPKAVNVFLGCWEDVSDSLPVYWCFDSISLNRSGYVHPYSFSGDSLKISELDFRFILSDSTLRIIHLKDSSETALKRSVITESPDVF